ncbi:MULTISPECIES: glycosyltransferase family 4 protein [unclassified Modestobacter]|uniref:glycosyltransferase family 4 protein n=1 Tax=unclassified Modestobacter TaxID=2643866 RepID=UPI0022AA8B7B|nr:MULTISPECIES: glycosyltransferase family 4 protein [unclassified Modestobacter]MCZ2823775.1 glycosyltransferase family 4 protein [Modestobacter sp. VKM Ac-2981]MCZ2852020.1 glycosyltransferase family 4 protein [Modestobacter sp. VKM Ac-2982]
MSREHDVVMALTYYSPYVSGLTEAARVVAEGLAAAGRRVLVVTTRHDQALPAEEWVNGVQVRRTPVVARLGKGVISPTFPLAVAAAARRAGVLNLHLPLLEAGPIALLVRGTPVVLTYQCDVSLSAGRADRLQESVMDRTARLAMRRSAVVVPSSDDYAEHSRLAGAMDGKSQAIAPPCLDRAGGRPAFRDGTGLHVGFVGRIVEEKGLEYLVEGFRRLTDPAARLLVAGDHTRIAGGSVVDRVRRAAGEDNRVRLLGFLPDESLPDFYASLDVFALPSVNSFEAFGIVQVEAMMTGVPALASDLPGVRIPVQRTGFGIVVPPRDPSAIHQALVELQGWPLDRAVGAAETRSRYGAASSIEQYARLFDTLAD